MSDGSGGPKKFGLSIKKRDEVDAKGSKPTANVFNDDDSSDEETKPKSSAAQLFAEKYSSGTKSCRSDKQLVEKAMAEDPTIFEYDSIHEKLEKQRDRATAEQKEADKEKKPKYAQNLINAHKKRELDQLLHDERVYKKEREEEGGTFNDKEVFVTGAYRQKMEEREKFRIEQARQDALNELTRVEGQGLWKSAFQSHMLDLRTGVDEDTTTTTQSMKLEPSGEEAGEKPPIVSKQIKEEEMEEAPSKAQESKMPTRESHQGKDSGEERREKRSGSSPLLRGRRSRSRDSRDSPSHHRRHHRASPDWNPRGGKRDMAPIDSVRSREEKSLNEKEREAQEINRRMVKIRAVLEKHNGDAEVEEARKRYMKRKEQGIIVPPLY